MTVLKTIHIFNDSGEIYDIESWRIKCHSKSKVKSQIQMWDTLEGTNHLTRFESLREDYKEEFYKYLTLYYEGGLFARYESVEQTPLEDLTTLVNYCNDRKITLFQCPSAIIVGFVHHPQLFGILTDENFHPLSTLFKDGNTMGYKTLITSLPLGTYLEKIKQPSEKIEVKVIERVVEPFDAFVLSGVGVCSTILGIVFGYFIGRRK